MKVLKRKGSRQGYLSLATNLLFTVHSTFLWDVSGFVRLFYILSKNKIFRIFGRHILDFR